MQKLTQILIAGLLGFGIALPIWAAENRPYAALAIVAPEAEQVVQDNSGAVHVRVTIDPELRIRDGHRLQLTLDGNPVATFESVGTHMLANVDRGSHVLAATVIDQAGNELIASPGIVFHMWQASALSPQRKQKPNPPPKKTK